MAQNPEAVTSATLETLRSEVRNWLSQDVLPLWSTEGFDFARGEFEESLTLEGKKAGEPRRAMVQARQIYSFKIAYEMGLLPLNKIKPLIVTAADNLIKNYQQPSGGYIHSRKVDGSINDCRLDLYTQSFAIFGMAHAFEIEPKEAYKQSALKVLNYLKSGRQLTEGGYTELDSAGQPQLASNPHMHLFEAALAWMDLDGGASGRWRDFADELQKLACGKFIDSEAKCLAELFDAGWAIQKDDQGRFMYEPGHQYEWAWLLSRYQNLTKQNLLSISDSLYARGDTGVDPATRIAYDQMWSSLEPKERSARFWPQAERLKAAALRATSAKDASVESETAKAVEALKALKIYFEVPKSGMWFDVKSESGSFKIQNAKGSSLYHIIGGIAEFDKMCEQLASSRTK